MRDRNEWFKEVERAYSKLKIVERPYAPPHAAVAVEAEDVPCCLGLHPHISASDWLVINLDEVRERSLDRPNVMSVTCPSCGMSNRIAWGSLMATPQKEAVSMLADSWNSR